MDCRGPAHCSWGERERGCLAMGGKKKKHSIPGAYAFQQIWESQCHRSGFLTMNQEHLPVVRLGPNK